MHDTYQSCMQYLKFSDILIKQSSKDLIAETAGVLALMVAGDQEKFGAIPVEHSLRLIPVEQLDDADAAMLASGLQTLVGVPGSLRKELSDDSTRPVK
jgi:hypothetical protein